jgi:hypothetical protein
MYLHWQPQLQSLKFIKMFGTLFKFLVPVLHHSQMPTTINSPIQILSFWPVPVNQDVTMWLRYQLRPLSCYGTDQSQLSQTLCSAAGSRFSFMCQRMRPSLNNSMYSALPESVYILFKINFQAFYAFRSYFTFLLLAFRKFLEPISLLHWIWIPLFKLVSWVQLIMKIGILCSLKPRSAVWNVLTYEGRPKNSRDLKKKNYLK